MLKENYKELREQLDEILYEMNIPKYLFHVLADLNIYIYQNKRLHPNAQKAFDLLHEISNEKITYFNLKLENGE